MTKETRKMLGEHWKNLPDKLKKRHAGMEAYYNEFKEDINMEAEEPKTEEVEEAEPVETPEEDEED